MSLTLGAEVSAPAGLVLDTNVVLDWLVFADASTTPMVDAVVAGRLRWLATAAMRAEFEHVLGRGGLEAWSPDSSQAAAAWERWATMMPAAPAAAPLATLRCTDPDDQKFIDLAAAHRGSCLLTRDRALLALARRARCLGVEISTPARWSGSRTAAR